jgi:PAS domain S-box-containing protein
MSLLGLFFNPSGLVPHGFCLTWKPGLIWLHAGSDALILLSYVSIPVSLIWLLRRRRDRAYHWIAHLFVTFFLTCSTVHGLAILTLWVPDYGVEALAKAATALVSVATASLLWIMAPRLARMLSPAELTSVNTELSHTIAKQEATLHQLLGIEQKLRNSNSRLEKNVAKHAADLRTSNTRLLELFAKRVSTHELLAKSEAEYRASFEAGTIGRVQLEPLSGCLLRVNGAFAAMLGYEAKDLVGREIWDFAYPDDRAAAVAGFSKLLAGEIDTCVMEKRYVRRDGGVAWMRMHATVVMDQAVGLPRIALAEIENIDLRRATRAALRATEVLLRLSLECGAFGVWAFDIRNHLVWTDGSASAMTDGEVPAENWLALAGPEYAAWVKRIHPDDRDQREARLQALFAGESEMVQSEYRVSRPDGEWSVLSHRCVVVERDAASGAPICAVGIVTDMTARSAALTELQGAKANLERSLQQRRAVLAHRHLLLREVYHRMNDTLQIVDRLFSRQAERLNDRAALEVLSDQRSRIYALGFVHGELMTSVDVETFDVAPFLHELCEAVLANGADRGACVAVDSDHLKVTLGHAIPLGLLVTELLNNCLRHASLPGSGRIAVGLRRSADTELTLTISDGDHPPAEAARAASFMAGLETRLVRDLACQLGAESKASCNNGLAVEITIFHRHP